MLNALRRTPRYRRPVSPMERLALSLNAAHHYRVDGIVEGTGDVDAERLQAAVDLAAAASPAIRVRLRGHLGFSRWVDSGIAPRVRKTPLSDWDGASERDAPFLCAHIDPLRGDPVADIVVVPCKDNKTRVVFRGLHAALDGRGMMLFMFDVFRALRGEAPVGYGAALTDLAIQKNHAASVTGAPSPPLSCIPVVPPGTDAAQAPLGYVWRRVILSRNVPQLLPKTAVFLARWARRSGAGDVRFTIPVDYRGLRTKQVGLGNMTGYLSVDVPEGATPRSVMQHLNQRVRAFADCREMTGLRKLRWLPVRLVTRKLNSGLPAGLYAASEALPTGGIVSMGLCHSEMLSFDGFAADFGYAIPGSVGKLNVVFTNYPTCVVVVFSVPTGYNDTGQIDDMISAYTAEFACAHVG